jgi:hypothetical protein
MGLEIKEPKTYALQTYSLTDPRTNWWIILQSMIGSSMW